MADDLTGRFEIHPAIGIARVGVSRKFFFGPEPEDATADGWRSTRYRKRPMEVRRDSKRGMKDLSQYRDAHGKLKRQAARFRLYCVSRDRQGKIVKFTEVREDKDLNVEWTVHLANTKASATKFRTPHERRNRDILAAHININTGEQSIGREFQWLKGQITGPLPVGGDPGKPFSVKDVCLGEARVDDSGRLVVVGPRNDAGWFITSPPEWKDDQQDKAVFHFDQYNNDGWYDNVSDGPVKATITRKGNGDRVGEAHAWLVVAPFNFAPDIDPFVTLYDVTYEKACERGFPGFPQVDDLVEDVGLCTSFEDDVLPLLEKSRQIRWLNGWAMQAETQDRHFWWNRSPSDDRFEGISKPSGHFSHKAAREGEAWRRALFAHLRNPWVTVTLDLNPCETATLSAVLEWLANYCSTCCAGLAVADRFCELEARMEGRGFDILLAATPQELRDLVDRVINETPDTDPRKPCLSRDNLKSMLPKIRDKQEALRAEFGTYRPLIMPRQAGNDVGVFSEADDATRFLPDPLGMIETTDRMLALTKVQYTHMRNWSEGNFVNRHEPCPDASRSATSEHYCDALTRLALEACNGGPLYPGIEVSRRVRNRKIYLEAFRIDPCKLKPGDLTRDLALPWQEDFFECNMDIDMAWWPASRPDQLFMRIPFDEIDSQPEEMRSWTGQILEKKSHKWAGTLINRGRLFIDHWHQLPVVVKKEVPPGIPMVRVPPVETPGEITETGLLRAAELRYSDWARWWKDSASPPVEIQYFDIAKQEKRYIIRLKGTGPRDAASRDRAPRTDDERPVVGHVLDTAAVDEWERTRRPDIEYYEENGRYWKRYFVYVADVTDPSPREVYDQKKLAPHEPPPPE